MMFFLPGSLLFQLQVLQDRFQPLTDIIARCKQNIKRSTIKKLKLEIAEEVMGRPFGPDIFPLHLNLKNAAKRELTEVFGKWPLTIGKIPSHYRWLSE
jgi:hypothetical protein